MNDVQLAYNGFGQLTDDYQDRGGAVNLSMTPEVACGYADGSANTIRPTTGPTSRRGFLSGIARDGIGGAATDGRNGCAANVLRPNQRIAELVGGPERRISHTMIQ